MKLYYAPESRAVRTAWLLYEMGLDFIIEKFYIGDPKMRTPEYLQKNPMGRVPLLEDGDISIISTAIFQREHAKLQKHAIAQGLFAAAKGEGSDKEKQKNLRPSQRSRPQVLLELKQILADTENLTGVLESQLKEIESRGWNRGYC